MRKKLKRGFFEKPTLEVAKKLLGKYLVVQGGKKLLSGKIVEAEAYIGKNDPASHAFAGMTQRTKLMFGEPGYTYIYLTYGMYYCLNFVTEKKGFPAAVLIRAVEPKEGVDLMLKRRRVRKSENLTNGPGKLCLAFGLDKRLNGVDLCSDVIWVEDRGEIPQRVVSTSRVGIKEGREKKWRFYIPENGFVSKR